MKKPNTVYFLLATSLIAGTFLSGCSDTTTNTTATPTGAMMSATPTSYTYTASPAMTAVPTATMSVTPGSTESRTYRDGSYTESASYKSPAGNEEITFEFKIENGMVSDISFVSPTTSPKSKNFQQLFLSGIKQQVIGKKLDEIGTFDKVNGSSLTPKAFNEAVTKLKDQAKA